MSKYIATVETNLGTEIACKLGNYKEVGTHQECLDFVTSQQRYFPESRYRIYQIEEVVPEKVSA